MKIGPVEELSRCLDVATALALASSLEIDGMQAKALQLLPVGHAAVGAFKTCFELFGSQSMALVLRGIAQALTSSELNINAVWSGPTFDGDGEHTTKALAHLIDEATEDVFASTYSATKDSDFVQALWRAIARNGKVTILLDASIQKGATAEMLKKYLAGANFLKYVPIDGGYGVQHSKVIIVDSKVALVTSANLSRAGAEKNLETGVVIRDSRFASQIRSRFRDLAISGILVALD